MKEKHPVYRAWIIFFCLFLAIGTLLFVYAAITGQRMNELSFRLITA